MPIKPLSIIVAGASGRMGARVEALARADARFEVAARITIDHPLMARDLESAGAIVDFSAPSASIAFAAAAARARKPIVIGTTGWTAAQTKKLAAFSRKTPIFLSPNFSRGVSVLFELAALASRLLPGCSAAIVETHHDRKKDAPSGTALKLAAATGRAKVPTLSQRLGDVVGDHTLTLAGPCERLELTHRADSRDVFARGALDAALWLRARRPGLYGMKDLLGLR